VEEEVRQRFERIEAILDAVARRQAVAEARVEEMDARYDRRMAASDARFERRMHGFEKLVRIGMREIADLRRLQKEGDEKLNALIDAVDGAMHNLDQST